MWEQGLPAMKTTRSLEDRSAWIASKLCSHTARSHNETVFVVWKAGVIVEVSHRLPLTHCLQLEDEAISGWRLKRVTRRSSNHTTTSDAPTKGNTTAKASMMNTPVFQVGRS